MSGRRIQLAVASFLDSEPARTLADLPHDELKAIATAIITSSYEDLGKEPRLLDGDDARQLLTECLPGRFKRKDPRAEHVPRVLDAFVDHLADSEIVAQEFELRTGIGEAEQGFVELVRSGSNEPRVLKPDAPVVHRAEKLGRNDPCFCGSGKKFKKCHGKPS